MAVMRLASGIPCQEVGPSQTRGVTGDGRTAFSVNTLRRLDDNAYVWQSVQRTLDGQSLPDTDEVVLKRAAKKQ